MPVRTTPKTPATPITLVPRGPQGLPGSVFTFVQVVPAMTWTIAHNLGHWPLVNTMTPGGVLMLGSVTHLSANVSQIDFDTPQAGTAQLI